jgi:hypothetical protein
VLLVVADVDVLLPLADDALEDDALVDPPDDPPDALLAALDVLVVPTLSSIPASNWQPRAADIEAARMASLRMVLPARRHALRQGHDAHRRP